MNAATVCLIVAIVSLSISLACLVYTWRRHSYELRNNRFQVELWRAQKRAHQRDRQHQEQRNARARSL